MAESSTSGLNRALDAIGTCDGQPSYREWSKKIRQAVGLYAPNMLRVLDGDPCPVATGLNDGDVAARKANNNRFYSILLFATSRSANITVRTHEGKTSGYLGYGAAAWKALKKGFDGHTKEARRTCWEQL